MSTTFPSLLLTLLFCLVANSFGEWYAERVNRFQRLAAGWR